MRNWPLRVVLVALGVATCLKILLPGHASGEWVEGIATLFTLPARLLTGMVFENAFSHDLPHSASELVLVHGVWALLAVGYLGLLRQLVFAERPGWMTGVFAVISLTVSGLLAGQLLMVWGCWAADTPCLSVVEYLAFVAGAVVWAATGLWLAWSRARQSWHGASSASAGRETPCIGSKRS